MVAQEEVVTRIVEPPLQPSSYARRIRRSIPEPILNESPRRPTALEYRPGDLMAARAEGSVRFYLRDPASDPLLVPPTLQALDPAMRAKIDEAYLRAQAAYQTLSLH